MNKVIALLTLLLFQLNLWSQPSLFDGGRYHSLDGHELVLHSQLPYPRNPPQISGDTLSSPWDTIPVWAFISEEELTLWNIAQSSTRTDWGGSSRLTFRYRFLDDLIYSYFFF